MLQFPEQIDRIALLAQLAELRHRVISHNIANVNTPGYQRLDVNVAAQLERMRAFDEQLQIAQRRIRKPVSQSVPVSQPVIVSQSVIAQDSQAVVRRDGNTVDIDAEMGHLNQNAMQFQMAQQILSKQLDLLRRAMT